MFPYRRLLRRFAAAPCVAATLALSACGTLNPVTLARLASLDPMTADPGQFAVRVAEPAGLYLPDGGAVLVVTSRRSDTGEVAEGQFLLEREGAVWALPAADAQRLRALQATIRRWEAEAPEANSGSLSVNLYGCTSGGGPDPSEVIGVDISLDGGATFLPLIRDLPVAEVLAAGAPDAGAGAGPMAIPLGEPQSPICNER